MSKGDATACERYHAKEESFSCLRGEDMTKSRGHADFRRNSRRVGRQTSIKNRL